MMIRRLALVPLAALTLVGSAACNSDSGSDSAASTEQSIPTEFDQPTEPALPDVTGLACPKAPAPAGAPAQWTFSGTTGSVRVISSTETTRPQIEVTTPFSVDQTTVHTLIPGDGAVVSENAAVAVCYEGVDGRTGAKFDSAYDNGQPAPFPLGKVVAGFRKAIAGQKVGSTVAVAMTPADGYPEGEPAAGIAKGDTLIFEIRILAAQG